MSIDGAIVEQLKEFSMKYAYTTDPADRLQLEINTLHYINKFGNRELRGQVYNKYLMIRRFYVLKKADEAEGHIWQTL